MLKVLLVEDENLIRRGLQYKMDWTEVNCVVVGEAATGREGLAQIKALRPDIVITDIRMPNMDGLEMLREGRSVCPFHAIIISGYGEFDYAQQAIRLGVAEYLLKPVDVNKLKNCLRRIAAGAPDGRSGETPEPDEKPAPLQNKYAEAMMQYIRQHYAEHISLTDLSQQLNISCTHLNAKFKAETGYTFHDFLNYYRIRRAVELQKRGERKLYEIAELVGFSDYKYFNKVYKKYTGYSPNVIFPREDKNEYIPPRAHRMSARGDKFMMTGKIGGFLSRHSKFTSSAALVLAVAAIFAFVYSPRVVGAAVTERELPVYSVERDGKFVSLSFDAAWGNEDTQMLIDILAKYNVKATFFVVGEWVDKYPESVKALHDAGHEVMNHSDAHPHMAKLTAKQIIDEVNRCSDKIEAVTGVRPTLFRCPYGEYDDNVIGTVNGMGLTAVQWDTDSLDWKKLTAGEIYKRVSSKVQPGSIVLFHNAGLHTPEALPSIIEYLLAEGYTIVPISEILLTGDTYIDHTGRQHAAGT